jgi:hypothetical protein
MRVSNVGAGRRTVSSRRPTGATGRDGRFAEHLCGVADDAGVGIDQTMVFSVGSVLPAQEVSGATDEPARARARRYGEDILDRLDELHLAILTGAVPAERLVRLAQMLRAKHGQVDDLRLRSIIEEIELRAEVEIAKLTRGR